MRFHVAVPKPTASGRRQGRPSAVSRVQIKFQNYLALYQRYPLEYNPNGQHLATDQN